MFDHVDNEEIKRIICAYSHTDFRPVYRLIRSNGEMDTNDFLPTNIENPNRSVSDKKKISFYSLSLLSSLQSIQALLETSPKMKKKYLGIAIGFTTNQRGISILSSTTTGHIDYFLRDYINNNPLPDFEVYHV